MKERTTKTRRHKDYCRLLRSVTYSRARARNRARVLFLPLTTQVLTYLKLTGMRLGLLINFYVPLIKNGIKRIVL